MSKCSILVACCGCVLALVACQAGPPNLAALPSTQVATQITPPSAVGLRVTPARRATARPVTPVPTATVGGAVTAERGSSPEVLLADPFRNNDQGWNVTDTNLATVQVENSRLTFNVTNSGAGAGHTHFTSPHVELPPDVDLQFDVQVLEGTDAWWGAACRNGLTGMYLFLVNNEGAFAVAAFSRLEQTWRVLAIGEAGQHLRADREPNTLHIVCAGDRLMLELNEARLVVVQDNTHTTGGVALAAEGLASGPFSVGYTNFVTAAPREIDYSRPVAPLRDTVAFETNKAGEWTVFQFRDPAIWERVTKHKGSAGFPAWALDGRRLVYTSDESGNQEIYVVEVASGAVLQVTDDRASDFAPAWSPDGDTLAFVSNRSGDEQIYIVPAAGGVPMALTHGTQIDYRHPAWSPDGQHIAYTSFRGGACDVYLINLANEAESQLTRNPASGIHDGCRAAWSPDGRQIAYPSARDGNLKIYLVQVETGEQTRLTYHPGIDSYPAWTRDGTQLVIVSDRAEQEVSTDLYLMNVDGSGYVRLTAAQAIVSYPTLAP
jgi:hypothetical protein